MSEDNRQLNRTRPQRPLVSLALFAYNQEKFIREAMVGALAQSYSPLEVIVSDDASTDRTFEIIKSIEEQYSGPHELIINRNEKNLGMGGHAARVYGMCRGEFIFNAAGDDVSIPHRVEVMVREAFSGRHAPSLAFSNAVRMSESGVEQGPFLPPTMPRQYTGQRNPLAGGMDVLGCAVAFRSELVARFPLMRAGIRAEDIVLIRRAYLLGGVCYIPEVLVKYRCHRGGISQTLAFRHSHEEFLKRSLEWSRDRSFRYEQLRADVRCMYPDGNSSIEKAIERGEQTEHRAISVLSGGIAKSAQAAIAEALVAKDMRLHLVKVFLKRWVPLLGRFEDR